MKETAVKHRVKDSSSYPGEVLLTQESMEELLPGGFICRSCVRMIERYNSVHQEVLSNMKEVFLSYSQSKWTLLNSLPTAR